MSNQPNDPRSPSTGGGKPAQGRGAPGAMTMAMRAVQVAPGGPKVLRIGLIKGGKIIEERVVRRRETVSIGTSEKNHFSLQAPKLPSRFELFELVGNDYVLNFTDDMDGRVALPGGVQELKQLRTSGGARNAGSHWQVKLNDSSRGKVQVENTTVLFQFVVPPPVQPRPQLPAAARGGFVAGIDWMFTAFVVFSFMIYFAFIVYLESADWPVASNITAEQLRDAIPFIIEEETPPPDDVPSEEVNEEEEGEEEEVAEANNNNANSNPNPQTESQNTESNAEATARIAEEARQQAQTALLGALGEGSLADVLRGGMVTGNASDVLAQTDGAATAQSGQGELRTRSGGGGSGQGNGLGNLSAAGGGTAGQQRGEGGEVTERVVRGNVNFGGGGDVGGSGVFDAAQVARMIRSRSSAFRRCYETSLRNNPTLAGRVSVRFTIQERGNVSGASATENSTGDSPLASCVVRVISGLRWPEGPEGGSVSFQYPFIFAPQN